MNNIVEALTKYLFKVGTYFFFYLFLRRWVGYSFSVSWIYQLVKNKSYDVQIEVL